MGGCAIRNSIRDLRFNHSEMTQQELADRIGVTRQTVNAIELGKYLTVSRSRVSNRGRVQGAARSGLPVREREEVRP